MYIFKSFRKALINKSDCNIPPLIKKFFGENPLLFALEEGAKSKKGCPLDVIKVLLDHGADVNYTDPFGESALKYAILTCRRNQAEVIRVLLEKGATVNPLDDYRRSPLCYAFQRCSHDIIKMMLDAGYSPNTCEHHISALFCATDNTETGLREDILDRLLQEPVDLNSRRYSGQSLFCFALCNGISDMGEFVNLGFPFPSEKIRVHDLELLLNKGASMQACRQHASPLLCAVTSILLLQESVIKLLLDRGACEEDSGWNTLPNSERWKIIVIALGWGKYEVGAIQLLLDIPGMMDCIKKSRDSIFEIALRNCDYQEEAVELLLSRMTSREVKVNKNKYLLHRAVENRRCSERTVKLLLAYDLPVNEINEDGKTPLFRAVENYFNRGNGDCKVIKALLISGARIVEGKSSSLLEYVLKDHMRDEDYMDYDSKKIFKILMRFFFLQNPQFDFDDCMRVSNENMWHVETCHKEELEQYANKCLRELKRMESRQIGAWLTLCEFVRGYCLPDKVCHDGTNVDWKNVKLKKLLQKMTQSCLPNKPASNRSASGKMGNLDQLFNCIADNKVKVYRNVLLARMDKSAMKQALKNMNVYTSNKGPDAKTVYLNEYVLGKISNSLTKKELLRFILAFYDRSKSAIGNKLGTKRKSESTTKLHKFPKH